MVRLPSSDSASRNPFDSFTTGRRFQVPGSSTEHPPSDKLVVFCNDPDEGTAEAGSRPDEA